jgi:hypothetical protein
MPAILPSRLKQQAALLGEYFDDPPAFIRSLHHLLEAYAERAYRAGQAGPAPSLSPSYQVRPQVLRYILLELQPYALENAQAALTLCDLLWNQTELEFRLLAAGLLGQVPCRPAEPILERLRNWITPQLEERLLAALFSQGSICLRRNSPAALLEFVDEWLEEKNVFYQQIGLRLLLTLINEPGYENLPVFYQLIQPLTRSSPTTIRPDLLSLIEALAHRSPNETSHFLMQTAAMPNSPETPLLIRQSLHAFPTAIQDELRQISRHYSKIKREEKSS